MLKRILAIPMAVVLVGMFISASNVPVPDESMKAVQETIEKDQKNTKEMKKQSLMKLIKLSKKRQLKRKKLVAVIHRWIIHQKSGKL